MNNDQLYDLLRRVTRKYIPNPRYQIFIYGSRAHRANRRFSDVDLGILGPAPLDNKIKDQIVEVLEKSDIPYLVQVTDFYGATSKFKNMALSKKISL